MPIAKPGSPPVPPSATSLARRSLSYRAGKAENLVLLLKQHLRLPATVITVVRTCCGIPPVELELIQKTGERPREQQSHQESLYAFRREEKPGVTPMLFVYCLDD